MPDCFIYDHVRTPRGRGRPDGALHEITPVELASTVLREVRDRNGLDTALVDDVVFGCVMPVGEQGHDIARVAVLNADYAETVAGVQINRFCASGLEATNMAAAQIMAGQSDMIIGGGVESMSRVPIGSDGGAWHANPATAFKTYFTPQGVSADLIATKWGFTRDDVDAYAVRDVAGDVVLSRDEHPRPETTMQSLASLKPAFGTIGEQYGYDSVAIQRYPEVERIDHVHHAGNSSGIVDGSAAILLGSR